MCVKSILRSIATILFFLLLSLAVGCQFPAYTIYEPAEVTDMFDVFISAVNSGDEETINQMLLYGTWSNQLEMPFSPANAKLVDTMNKSRSYKVIAESALNPSTRSVELTLSLTSFNMTLFEEALFERVKVDIETEQYEGHSFSDSEDTFEIIERNKLSLLGHPEDFYAETRCKVIMVLSKGKWYVVLNNDFYHVLLGDFPNN